MYYFLGLILLVILVLLLLVAFVVVFYLFYTHVRFVLKESGTLQSLINEDDFYNFGIIANLNFLFGSIWYFFLPLNKTDEFEGHYFYRRGRDPEF